MTENVMEIMDTKSDTQSIDSNNSKMNKIFQNDDIQKAIDQIIRSDSIENPDFNAADYINQLFPTEQSLSTIDDVLAKMENECQQIDENIRSVVRSQTTTAQDGRCALSEAQKVIGQLFEQIIEIKTRAEKTEDMVKEITRDIKQLDWAKKNLTSAITTLNHLHILVGGIENLSKLAENRQYGELLNPLQAIIEVNKHFQQYTEIPKIKDLSIKVQQIQERLATQITADFHNTLATSSSSQSHSDKLSLSQLADACSVVSVLEDQKVKAELLKWFISLQLQEYEQLFHESDDIAWIAKIDKRYAWLKRHLLDFENRLGKVFPVDWEISERITIQFCLLTRDSLTALMQKRRTEIDVKLLLFAISKTQQFELLLAKRFNGLILAAMNITKASRSAKILPIDDKPISGTDAETNQIGNSPFIGLIGACFEAFLDIYIDSIDRNLAELIERFVLDNIKTKTEFDPISNNSTVFPSCADLFVFYKKCLVQCTQLSTEKPMYQLTQIFKKYLREYASKILEQKIPKASAQATSLGTSMSMLTKDFQNLSTAAGNVIQNLLKEGDQPRYSRDEIVRLCCILTTAEYCVETVDQLEAKLKEKCDEAYADKIDLSDEKDIFHRCISNCIHLMVQDIEWGCEAALIVMNKTTWYNIQNVGDQSPFVNSIQSNFHTTIPIIRDNLSASRKYYTQFCHKFVNSFIPRYINALYKCRLMNSSSASSVDSSGTNASSGSVTNNSSILGCEQLLLDTHSLKTILLDLPSIGSQVKRKAPASYSKVVVKGMTKAEMIIKIVMQPTTPAQTFIEQYLKLLPESSQTEFNKIMDMKGLKRSDSTYLLELYKRMAPKDLAQTSTNPFENDSDTADGSSSSTMTNLLKTSTNENSIASTIKQTASNVTSTLTASADKGRIRKLENLIKKRLP